jgi:hypothetical protein
VVALFFDGGDHAHDVGVVELAQGLTFAGEALEDLRGLGDLGGLESWRSARDC